MMQSGKMMKNKRKSILKVSKSKNIGKCKKKIESEYEDDDK